MSARAHAVNICLTCIPFARVAGLRGITAKVVILEEAAFIDQALFFEVIVPLLGVEGKIGRAHV